MRKGQIHIKKSAPFFMAVFLALTSSLSFAQKDFYMNEKKLYENYEMSVHYFEEGKKLYREEKFNKAEKKFKQCLEVFPQHAQANFYMAHLMYKKSDLENALHYIEEAKKNYEFMNHMFTLAYEDYISQLREQKDDIQDSINQYEQLKQQATQEQQKMAYDSKIASLQSELGTVKSRLAEPLPQEKQIPDNYFYLMGNIFFKLEKYQEAHDQYVQAIEQNPKHQEAYNNLINIYFMTKQYERAMSVVKEAESKGVVINPKLKEAVQKELDKKGPF